MFDSLDPGEKPSADMLAIAYAGHECLDAWGVERRDGVSHGEQAPQRETAANEWVERIQSVALNRDSAAFAELFGHFAPRIKAFLMKSGTDEAMAEECAQDVMATVWTKAAQFDPARASVATWVFTIARNRRIDMLRRQKRPEPEELPWGPEAEPDQHDALVMQQETEKLVQALTQLPEKQRTLVDMAYFGDMSHSEIADITGLPLGTIKSRVRLALERLRHEMHEKDSRR
jgi:RNA polymerase sigma factor (sigma-70 family)